MVHAVVYNNFVLGKGESFAMGPLVRGALPPRGAVGFQTPAAEGVSVDHKETPPTFDGDVHHWKQGALLIRTSLKYLKQNELKKYIITLMGQWKRRGGKTCT